MEHHIKKNNFVVDIFYFIYCHVNCYFDLKTSVSMGSRLCLDGYILILIGNSGFVVVRMSRTNSFACWMTKWWCFFIHVTLCLHNEYNYSIWVLYRVFTTITIHTRLGSLVLAVCRCDEWTFWLLVTASVFNTAATAVVITQQTIKALYIVWYHLISMSRSVGVEQNGANSSVAWCCLWLRGPRALLLYH